MDQKYININLYEDLLLAKSVNDMILDNKKNRDRHFWVHKKEQKARKKTLQDSHSWNAGDF